MKLRIAVTSPYYVPAVRAGGPIPGIRGIIAAFGDQDIRVFTGDRDLGARHRYPEPFRGSTEVEGVPVTYLAPNMLAALPSWLRALRRIRDAEVVYVNSMFSAQFTLFPLLLLWLTRFGGVVVISPRGELAASALKFGHRPLKRAWLAMMRVLGMARSIGNRSNVLWLASSEREAADICRHFDSPPLLTVPETLRSWDGAIAEPRGKDAGPLRVICVGRLAPIKGTLGLVRAVARVRQPLILTLVGLEEDGVYTAAIRRAVAECPAWVEVRILGALDHERVRAELLDSDLFALLTLGENFGHAIGEALQTGLPVLISDQTPWTFAEVDGAAIVIPADQLANHDLVAQALDAFAQLDQEDRARRSRAATECALHQFVAPGAMSLPETLERMVNARRPNHS